MATGLSISGKPEKPEFPVATGVERQARASRNQLRPVATGVGRFSADLGCFGRPKKMTESNIRPNGLKLGMAPLPKIPSKDMGPKGPQTTSGALSGTRPRKWAGAPHGRPPSPMSTKPALVPGYVSPQSPQRVF